MENTSALPAPNRAIPTTYKGVQMRSRMEARCAFFLDLMGWDWEYEPESIMLHTGVPFRPDFRANEGMIWVECRGYDNQLGNRQIQDFAAYLPEIRRVAGDDGIVFLVMGPTECTVYGVESRQPSIPAQVTFCPQCDAWSLHDFNNMPVLCPRCINPSFIHYSINVADGKFYIGATVAEDAAKFLTKEILREQWFKEMARMVLHSVGNWHATALKTDEVVAFLKSEWTSGGQNG